MCGSAVISRAEPHPRSSRTGGPDRWGGERSSPLEHALGRPQGSPTTRRGRTHPELPHPYLSLRPPTLSGLPAKRGAPRVSGRRRWPRPDSAGGHRDYELGPVHQSDSSLCRVGTPFTSALWCAGLGGYLTASVLLPAFDSARGTPARQGCPARWFGVWAGLNRPRSGGVRIGRRGLSPRRVQARSNRSRFMTLSHAATKSRTNFCCASSLA